MSEFAYIPLHHITESLTNPRKTFDPAKLQELADSIKTSGVLQPILVRPLPGERVADTDRAVQFEIVTDERRYSATPELAQWLVDLAERCKRHNTRIHRAAEGRPVE